MANSDDKSLPDQALEALLYAPIGIAYEVLDRLPTWVARGKSQATITKVLGKMAVQKGQSEFEDVVSDIFGVKLGDDAEAAKNGAEAKNQTKPEPAAAPKSSKSAESTKSAESSKKAKPTKSKAAAVTKTKKTSKSGKPTKPKTAAKKNSAKKPSAKKAARPKTAGPKEAKTKAPKPAPPVVPDEADLALASYGSMPASQIVKRLDSLSPSQLKDVQAFEEANRHRVTVLNRIRQIQRSA